MSALYVEIYSMLYKIQYKKRTVAIINFKGNTLLPNVKIIFKLINESLKGLSFKN